MSAVDFNRPPTKEEIDQYWEAEYKQKPTCNQCGHPHSEHYWPENFPTSVICHTPGCTCGHYT